jgi:hypothetical protein
MSSHLNDLFPQPGADNDLMICSRYDDANADGELALPGALGSAALSTASAQPPIQCFTHAAAQASLGPYISPIDASHSTNAQAACEQIPPFHLLAISSEEAQGAPPAAEIAGTWGQMKLSSRVCALCRFPFKDTK